MSGLVDLSPLRTSIDDQEEPTLRRMTEADLPVVLDIEGRVFSDPWSQDSFEYEISNRRHAHPLVLEWKGRIIGYAVVWTIFEELHIANIAVAPEFQRQGWGEYLMEQALAIGKNREVALLEVRETNIAAIRLYEKFGFKPVRTRKQYYPDRENAIVMRKVLSR